MMRCFGSLKWRENPITVLLLIAYSILYSLLNLQTEKERKKNEVGPSMYQMPFDVVKGSHD